MKNWTKIVCLIIAILSVIAMTTVTAFAMDEGPLDAKFYGEPVPSESTADGFENGTENLPSKDESASQTEESSDSCKESEENDESENDTPADGAFSVKGNGEVLDNIVDKESGKEFYTITTANNQTFYIIIDHASSTKNVYMLSMIDENDLKEFLSEEEPEKPTDTPPSVDFGDDKTEKPDTDAGDTPKKSGGNTLGTILIILALGAVAGGLYFYFKIYKPKKEASVSDEDMEYIDDGETVSEDEPEAETSELSFEDDETEYNDEE